MSGKTSLITPVRNGAAYIASAMESVLCQLDPNDEFFIVDDGSSDNTWSIVTSFCDPRIQLISTPRRGVSAARNAGLALANGEFIAFLDSDDAWTPGRHIAMLNSFAEKPSIDAVFGRIRIQFEPDAVPSRGYEALDGKLVPNGMLGSGLFRQSLVKRVGGFAEDMQAAEDIDFYNRLEEAGMQSELIDFESFIYRRHGSNATNDKTFIKRWFLEMLRRKIARARACGESRNAIAGPPP